ncbi:MAG TPA: aldo/keto reductase [Kineosporiaceae bacterium]|jgi:aryl-alcohol dehydrogenase-like predicted oxidoreductase|nr:aldo/keto reductase [Kineosporiaceae bacterium]
MTTDMTYRQLGNSGLQVSVISLGTMTFGGRGKFAQVGATGVDDARRQVDLCLDAGVNLIDTADVYSDGLSEEIVGEVLAGRRDDVLVATKARFSMGSGPNDAGLSRHHLIRACEASLRRLRTEYIDLYQVHQWDGRTPVEETLAALDHLVASGKVRYIGCSNFSGWHVMKSLAAARREHLPSYVSQQIHYTLQARDAELELLPLAVDQGLGVLVWSPLAGGLLSGKYRRGTAQPEGSRHVTDWNEPPVHDEDRLYDVIETLVEIGKTHGVSAAQVSLAWLLRRPGITGVIVGARREDQLSDNLAAAGLQLTDDDVTLLERVSRPPLPYPYWHQAAAASERLSEADLALLRPYLG